MNSNYNDVASIVSNEELLHEEFYHAKKSKYIMIETPRVSINDFIEQVQPTDTLVTYPNMPRQDSFKVKLGKMAHKAFFQGMQNMPFSSSKMMIDRGMVAGYSANPKHPHDLAEIKLTDFIRTQNRIIICRPKDNLPSPEKTIKYIKSKYGVPYDTVGLFKTAWNKFTLHKFPSLVQDKFEPWEIHRWKDPLFCSTVIAFSYKFGGLPTKFAQSPLEVWPKDFLLSDRMEKVALFQR